MRIMLVGGGTGGHFYPLIAVAEVIRDTNPQTEIYYMGPNPYNSEALADLDIKYIYCPAGKIRRYFSLQNFLDSFKVLVGLFIAWIKLFLIYPDVIFSKGGYTAVPVLLMARFYRIPVVIHESDSKPGRANLLAKKFARYIGVAFKSCADYFPSNKTALVGIPIRKAIRESHPDPFGTLGISNNRPVIYITGGSLGAEKINDLILRSLTQLLPHFTIFHQTGPTQETSVIQTAQTLVTSELLLANYYVKGTMSADTVSALLEASSLIITRAGSTTLFEIALHGKPAIVIPIPEEISHDQRTNAYSYARGGGATVMEEGNLTPNLLIAEIMAIIGNQERYQAMSLAASQFGAQDGATSIAQVLVGIGIEHGSI